jgi:ABC-type transporter Mla MlaB component
MAKMKQKNLIGYDPLAWMHQDIDSYSQQQFTKSTEDTALQVSEAPTAVEKSPVPHCENAECVVDANTAIIEEPVQDLSDETSIALDAVLHIQQVSALHERLVVALNHSHKIAIDASAVTVADTATLQLLLVLKRTALQQNKEVVIDFPSDQFINAAELLGISAMLEVDQVAAGLF